MEEMAASDFIADEDFVINMPPHLPLIDISSDLSPVEWPECCIYKVPKHLRKVNEEAYTPKLVSIGPFHHDREELKDLKMYKLRYLKDFLKRTGKRQEDLLKIIKDNEEKINHCYSEDDCRGESDDFVKMILLDAIFIIELFLKVRDNEKEEEVQRKGKDHDKKETDYILSKPWLRNHILHDLILVENQLPFFVLEKLYMFSSNDSSSCNHSEEGKQIDQKHKNDLKEKDAPFVKLSRNYFKRYDQQQGSIIGKEVKHFTDLIRYLFYPPNRGKRWSSEEGSSDSSKKEKRRKSGIRFGATKLHNIGLKFKVRDDSRLLDIQLPSFLGQFRCLRRFRCCCVFAFFPCLICFLFLRYLLGCFGYPMHILKVPQLVIDYDTEAIFRNLMALEQCHYPSKTYICSYVLLLDRLIDTEKDVDLLADKEIIANHLGSNKEVATLINNLGVQIVATTSSYDVIAKHLNEHCENPWNRILAILNREYFPNIFRGTATVVGLIVLGFTLWNFLKPCVV